MITMKSMMNIGFSTAAGTDYHKVYDDYCI